MRDGWLRRLILTIGRQTPAYRAAGLNRFSRLPLSRSKTRTAEDGQIASEFSWAHGMKPAVAAAAVGGATVLPALLLVSGVSVSEAIVASTTVLALITDVLRRVKPDRSTDRRSRVGKEEREIRR